MSNTQSSQESKPLAERSSQPVSTTPSPEEINRMVRYRDNLKLIPETMEYDEKGRKIRQELTRVDELLWKYNNGFFG